VTAACERSGESPQRPPPSAHPLLGEHRWSAGGAEPGAAPAGAGRYTGAEGAGEEPSSLDMVV